MKKLIFYIAILLGCQSVFSQVIPDPADYKTSPNGYFDDVFDHYGNKYKLKDLRIYDKVNGQLLPRNPMLCESGIFELYFEAGCGMEGNSTAENQRRAVVCQVFQDLSNFINSPLKSPNNQTKVKIWVRKINSVVPNPSGVLGLASSFYNVAYNANTNYGGIADNEIWKTIHAGVDSYINVATPLVTTNSEPVFSGLYYHGMMAFNFNSITWNTNLGINAPAGQYDLYTVVLHEVAHALGLASLINGNGNSKFGAGYNYFTRYDRFLKNSNSTQFLINNTGACSLYNYKFNTSLNTSILNPGALPCVADTTVCTTAIKYVGASNTIPVYTPNCFINESSLSHFEDECVSPFVNNGYFVMSNANGAGVTKRFLKPEERGALCDIGYSVNTTYGNASQFSYKNYGGTVCTGIQVAGINDGINSNASFSFIGNPGVGIVISGILNNDFTTNTSDLRFECLQDVYDTTAIFSVTSGTSATNVTFTSVVPGIHLLRYIPFNNATGQRGNIAYIYAYVIDTANCAVPNSCNLVLNGDFEQSSAIPTNLGQINRACGWINASAGSPDYMHQGANNNNNDIGIPCNKWGTQLDNIILNRGYVAFGDNSSVSGNNSISSENFVTKLTSPLQPNTSYQLSFDVSLVEGVSRFRMKPQAYLSTSLTISTNYYIAISNSEMLFNNPTFSNISDGWERITFIIPARPIAGEQYLYLGALKNPDISILSDLNVDNSCNYMISNNMGQTFTSTMYYLDNVELIPLNGAALNLPEDFCLSTTLSNLSQYIVAAPANGVFSGPGVTQSGSSYSFNAGAAGVGTHTISYTYTNTATSCTISISSQITIVDCGTGGPGGSCPQGLVFTTTENGPNVSYEAGTIVTHTAYAVGSSIIVRLKAEESVTLNPGSVIDYGSDFIASIQNCSRIIATKAKTALYSEKDLSIYPNPTKGLVTISSKDLKISSIVVNAIDGRTIHTRGNINDYSYELTLENFPTGYYSIIVETVDGQIIFDKIIKN